MREHGLFRTMVYGIRGRFLKYVLLLLAAAMLCSGVGVAIEVRRSVRQAALDQYFYNNERIFMLFEEQYEKSDALMKRCIVNREFQNSLLSSELTMTERQSLEQLLTYLDLDYLQGYLYVDNKGIMYGKPYQKVSYQEFLDSGFLDYLGNEYSVTKWFVAEDKLFHGTEPALFIGRYIRNMDFAHKPGVLIFKMAPEFFDFLLSEVSEGQAGYLFMDQNGTPFYGKSGRDGKGEASSQWMEKVAACVREADAAAADERTEAALKTGTEAASRSGSVRCSAAGIRGTALYTRHEATGFWVVTFLPDQILNRAVFHALGIMVGVYGLAVLLACVLSVYFSKRFTGPIRQINDAMQEFDAGADGQKLELHTGTELDTIGNSYNKMTEDIRNLLVKVREQERELYDSELNSLMYQINPHFLYNTLDTIYMLARINHEETTMRMIQALSKFLKVSLSKESGVIFVEDELEHVKSYMDIQRIRNNDLFTYEIHCEKECLKERVMKLILQPLVENSIKHGFCDIYDGGLIRIHVEKEGEKVVFRVWNNGEPMNENDIEKIQQMYQCDYREIYGFFKDREGGYGISNVMGRLRLKYGSQMEYYYEVKDGGTMCTIKIPRDEGEHL